MSTTKARFRAAIVAIAPAVLLFAFLPAMGIVGSEILGRRQIWLVAGAVVVMAAASFVSLGAAPYVGAATAIVKRWLLAYEMWRQRGPRHSRNRCRRPDGTSDLRRFRSR